MIILTILLINGCTKNEAVSCNIEIITSSDISSNINSWIDTIEDETGIFIARINKNKKVDEYYVFAKNTNLGDFGVQSDGSSGIKINYNINNKLESNNTVYKIQTINKKSKYIIIDNKKIETIEIELIN